MLCTLTLLAAACLEPATTGGTVSQDAAGDAPSPSDTATVRDTPPPDPGVADSPPATDPGAADAAPADAGADACGPDGWWLPDWGACVPRECGEGELWFWDLNACVPTDWLGCREAAQCDPDDPATPLVNESEDKNIRSIQQRMEYDPIPCVPVCQTVTLNDDGATSSDPSCVTVDSTTTLNEDIAATGVALWRRFISGICVRD